MSSFWKKTMVWLGLEDEEPEGVVPHGEGMVGPGETVSIVHGDQGASVGTYGAEGYLTDASPAGETAGAAIRGDQARAGGYAASTYTPSAAETTGFDVGSGVRMLPATDTRVQIIEPQGFADAQEIGERFRQAQPVIVDLKDVERDTARRIVDFASGLTFALRGRMRKVADHVFLLLPAHATIPEDEKDRLRASGYDV